MKRVLIAFLVPAILTLVIILTPSNLGAAGSSTALLRLSVDKTSATANNSDAITLSIHLFQYECSGTKTITSGDPPQTVTYHPTYAESYDASSYCSAETGNSAYSEIAYSEAILTPVWAGLSVSGSGVNFSPSTFTSTSGSISTVTSKITSSVAGSKTITIAGSASWAGHNTVTVNFTAPATNTTTSTNTNNTSTTKTSTTTSSNTTNNQTTTTAKTPPTAPILKELTVGSSNIAADKIEGKQFKISDRKMFSGDAIPNGIVHLYFHSDPFEDQVIADKDGHWSYELKEDIGVGDHTLQVAVTDPETKLTSEKSQPAKFALVGSVQDGTIKSSKKLELIWFILGGLTTVSLIAGAVFVVWRKKQAKSQHAA